MRPVEIASDKGTRLHHRGETQSIWIYTDSSICCGKIIYITISAASLVSPAQFLRSFMPVRWFPSSLTDFCKKLSYVLDQEIRLFKRGKVPTPRHFRPLDYIVFLSNPA